MHFPQSPHSPIPTFHSAIETQTYATEWEQRNGGELLKLLRSGQQNSSLMVFQDEHKLYYILHEFTILQQNASEKGWMLDCIASSGRMSTLYTNRKSIYFPKINKKGKKEEAYNHPSNRHSDTVFSSPQSVVEFIARKWIVETQFISYFPILIFELLE